MDGFGCLLTAGHVAGLGHAGKSRRGRIPVGYFNHLVVIDNRRLPRFLSARIEFGITAME